VVVWLRRSGAEAIACLRQIDTLLTANPRRPLARANTCHRSAKAREDCEDGEACGESLPLPPWTGIFLCHGTANTIFKVLDGDGLLSVLTSQPALRRSSLSSIVIVSSLWPLASPLPSPLGSVHLSLSHLSLRPHAQHPLIPSFLCDSFPDSALPFVLLTAVPRPALYRSRPVAVTARDAGGEGSGPGMIPKSPIPFCRR
jgi:hypothetical protein